MDPWIILKTILCWVGWTSRGLNITILHRQFRSVGKKTISKQKLFRFLSNRRTKPLLPGNFCCPKQSKRGKMLFYPKLSAYLAWIPCCFLLKENQRLSAISRGEFSTGFIISSPGMIIQALWDDLNSVFCWEDPFSWVDPGRLTWNIIIEVWKIMFLSKWVICMFQGVFEKEHHLPNLHFSASKRSCCTRFRTKKEAKNSFTCQECILELTSQGYTRLSQPANIHILWYWILFFYKKRW